VSKEFVTNVAARINDDNHGIYVIVFKRISESRPSGGQVLGASGRPEDTQGSAEPAELRRGSGRNAARRRER